MEKWKKFSVDSESYIVKFIRSDAEPVVTCFLSDFKSLWSECITSTSILQKRFTELNRRLDVDDDKLLEIITKLPESIQFAQFNPAEDGVRKLCFEYHLSAEIILRHNWHLQKSDEQTFFEQITKPMMNQMLTFYDNQTKLIDIVKRKDQEIEQYKLDGAPPITRQQLVTKPFDISDVPLNVNMFECPITEFTGEFASNDGLTTKASDQIDLGQDDGKPGTNSNTPSRLKGLTPIKRIQKIQYADSDDDEETNESKPRQTKAVPIDFYLNRRRKIRKL